MPQSSAPLDTVPSQFMPRLRSEDWGSRECDALPIVVLASGHGSNLQAIINRFENDRRVEVAGVASNNPSAFALSRARKRGIPYAVFSRKDYPSRASRDEEMADWILGQEAKLIVLAGYLEILSAGFVNRFHKRIINIHPSLLPRFPGLNSIQRAHEAKVRKSGVTIHFVDEGVDTGPIIKQQRIWKLPGESLQGFQRRVHAKEHKLLPKVIEGIASGRIPIGSEASAASPLSQPPELEAVGVSSFRSI
jgi:phosphoribosylglycinamide formyltransferase 1